MQLGADAVVLVLRPNRRAKTGQNLVLVGDRVGEHRLERAEETQFCLAQAVVARQFGGVAQVAGEHARPLHVGQLAIEGRGHGRLQVSLTQSDAQLTAQHFDDRFGGCRIAALEQRAEWLLFGLAACRRHLA